MREHRIEFICKTPNGELETLTITVAANARADRLATLTKTIRAVLEEVVVAEGPLTIEHCRDYAIPGST